MNKNTIILGIVSIMVLSSVCGCGGSNSANKPLSETDNTTEVTTEITSDNSEENSTPEQSDTQSDTSALDGLESQDEQWLPTECIAYVGNSDTIYYSEKYAYDSEGRLIDIERYIPENESTYKIFEASYDDKGNLVHAMREHVVCNQLISTIGPFDYTYDDQGGWIKRVSTSDSSSYTTAENYYEDGKLVSKALTYHGTDEDAGWTVKYFYDNAGGCAEEWYYNGSFDSSIIYDSNGTIVHEQMSGYYHDSQIDKQGHPTYIYKSSFDYEENYNISNVYDENSVLSKAYYVSENQEPDLTLVFSYDDYDNLIGTTASEEDPFARYSDFENCRLTSTSEFSNGLAWINFEDQNTGEEYTGCIDKGGNLILYMEKTLTNPSPFSEKGISLLRVDNDSRTVSIDQTGIVKQVNETEGRCLIQSDYALFVKIETGFDVNKKTYQIFSPDGTLVKEIVDDPDKPIMFANYQGGGIFSFLYDNAQFSAVDLYFAKSDTFVLSQLCSQALVSRSYSSEPSFNGKYLLYYCGVDDSEAMLTITDDNGNWKDIMIPAEFGDEPVFQDCSDRYILLRNGKEFYYIYDVDNDTFRKLDGKYTDRLYWASYPYDALQKASCSDEAIAVLLEGQDGESYVGLYNPENMELLCDPIRGDSAEVVHKAVIIDSTVYDLKQTEIRGFTNNTLSFDYSDGVYHYYDSSTNRQYAGYYDEDFNDLFPKGINYAGAKHINMNNT